MPPELKTCSFCKKEGFVWYMTAKKQWMLAEPKTGTLDPDPKKVHLCPVKEAERALRRASNGMVGRYGTKSGRSSSYRRGKSPASYG